MMLDELGFQDILSHLEKVVAEAIHRGITTPDLGGGGIDNLSGGGMDSHSSLARSCPYLCFIHNKVPGLTL